MNTMRTQFLTFSQAVLTRPGMYTLNGTLPEVIAFLEGYYSGMAKGKLDAPPVLEWVAFRQWVAAQMDVDIAQAFSAFAQRYQDNQTAITTLAQWLARFLEA